jgi:CHAD domain-containing protein
MDRPSKSSASEHVCARRASLRLIAANEKKEDNRHNAARSQKPVKARPLEIERDATLDDVISLTLSSCLEHFLANQPPPGQLSATEQVHQMRVALRRFRAAVGLFRRAIQSAELESAAARAKAIAAQLGAARDLDVFGQNLESGPFAKFRGDPSFYALLDAVECRRRRAYEDVRSFLQAPHIAQFVTELRSALARRAWTAAPSQENRIITSEPGSARKFAIDALDRLHRRALRRFKGLASRPEHEQHLARIALKKLRYAGEFFESLFSRKEDARAYLRAAAKAQDELGAYNDMAVATKLLQDIGASNGANTAYAAGFVRGWLAHAQAVAAEGAGKNEKAVRKLKPFWR